MLGNFDFMKEPDRVDDYGEFASDCEMAETFFAEGRYEPCMMYCRKSAELIVRWMYRQDIFGLPDIVNGKSIDSATQYERLENKTFVSNFKNPTLRGELHWVRMQGNDAIHEHENDPNYALRGLKAVFDLMQLVESRVWEMPYAQDFFEPCFEQMEFSYNDEELPLEHDYPALIAQAQAEGNPRLAAKWALLLKAERPDFDLSPFTEALPQNTFIGPLIRVLSDKRELRSMIQESALRLSQTISGCYNEFDYREMDTIITMSMKACRRLTAASHKAIDSCLNKINTKMEELTHE